MLAVAIGGACGAMMRFWLAAAVQRAAGGSFPWGTLTVNVLGSFLLGFL
ncbi:MAG: CrcB family protein, partial [Mariprofundaceae bacterium]|nr:CrcB family protein [Mariprofundaceae bacterium]